MARTTVLLPAVAALLLLVAPAARAADVYNVAATISHDGETIASPSLRVDQASPARVSVTGEVGYELSVQLMPDEDEDALQVTVQLTTTRGTVSSVVTSRIDRPISVAAGDVGLQLTISRDDDA